MVADKHATVMATPQYLVHLGRLYNGLFMHSVVRLTHLAVKLEPGKASRALFCITGFTGIMEETTMEQSSKEGQLDSKTIAFKDTAVGPEHLAGGQTCHGLGG